MPRRVAAAFERSVCYNYKLAKWMELVFDQRVLFRHSDEKKREKKIAKSTRGSCTWHTRYRLLVALWKGFRCRRGMALREERRETATHTVAKG